MKEKEEILQEGNISKSPRVEFFRQHKQRYSFLPGYKDISLKTYKRIVRYIFITKIKEIKDYNDPLNMLIEESRGGKNV